jgi:hypothetical protein
MRLPFVADRLEHFKIVRDSSFAMVRAATACLPARRRVCPRNAVATSQRVCRSALFDY